jgi:hypothetical protein
MLSKRLAIWVYIFCTLLAFHVPKSSAQEVTEAPLVINISGQLYQWSIGDSEPTPTSCDLQGNEIHMRYSTLIQSADGVWAAFMVLPGGMEDGAPTPTGNLWVCNLERGVAYSLSNANPYSPGLVANGVFSPDSRKIAWTEVNDPPSGIDARILVHDLDTQETSVLVTNTPLDEPCGVGASAPHVEWGEAGIVVAYFIASESDCGLADESGIFIYDENGTLQSQFPFAHFGLNLMKWVEVEGEPQLVFRNNVDNQLLFSVNPQDGSIVEQDGILEVYRPDAAIGAGHFLESDPWNSPTPPLFYLPDSSSPLEGQIDAALSPDGSLMVLVIGKTLYLAHDGILEPAPWNDQFYAIDTANGGIDYPEIKTGQLEVAWTSPSYRLIPADTIESVCPTVEALYLNLGGRVIEGLGDNNIRNAPWTTAPIIGSIPVGDPFVVVDIRNFSPFNAPPVDVCTDGIRWREVLYGDVVGWTAEAQGDTYFLESIN